MFQKFIEKLIPRNVPLDDWFNVDFNDEYFFIKANPPGRNSWEEKIGWREIQWVCFKVEDLGLSDGIYVFTSRRPESYVVPVEAAGGADFWDEILKRKLFDAELAIQAATAQDGLYCWPEQD